LYSYEDLPQEPVEQHQLFLDFLVEHGSACLIYRIAHLFLIFGEDNEKNRDLDVVCPKTFKRKVQPLFAFDFFDIRHK